MFIKTNTIEIRNTELAMLLQYLSSILFESLAVLNIDQDIILVSAVLLKLQTDNKKMLLKFLL